MTISGLGTNRILAAAERMRGALATGQKLDGSGPITGDLTELENDQKLGFDEWFAFQQKQAEAHASGRLTTDEAMTIYTALGGEGMPAGGWAEGVDLALKLTIYSVMGQLIGAGR